MHYLHSKLTGEIIGSALAVHKELGPGLLESAYEECLTYELLKAGFTLKRQHPIPLVYRNVKLDCGFRMDLWVENKIIVEIKAVEAFHRLHMAQLITYMKLSNSKLGLLINFNVRYLKDGIRRVIL